MPSATQLLATQMDEAYRFVHDRVQGLTDEEFFWEPMTDCWTVRPGADGRWHADYAEPDPDPPPFTTIAWRLVHLAECKVMYHEYAFGPARLIWPEIDSAHTAADAIAELERGQRLLVDALGGLTDADLDAGRMTNWGEEWPTWRVLWTMIDHDLHHGGEIGALRDLYRERTMTTDRVPARRANLGTRDELTTIKMPQLGESVTEGTIERWLVKEGDTVEQYDPLFEVVTDKVNAEVPAEVAGTITKIMVPDGETVKVGTPLAEISGDGAAAAPAEKAPAESPRRQKRRPPRQHRRKRNPSPRRPPRPSSRRRPHRSLRPARRRAGGAGRPGRSAAAGSPLRPRPAAAPATDGSVRMTPAVRRLVREHDIDITQLKGSGAGGRVTREDVLAFVEGRGAAAAAGRTPPAPAAAPGACARITGRGPARSSAGSPAPAAAARSRLHAAGARSRRQPLAMSRSR